MIPPHTRSLLSDALTPPAGMRFDLGVVTTYSLDPTILLSIPLHLAWLGLGDSHDPLTDPIRLVEALRRVASRLTVFSERGRMQAPDRPHPLYGLLEGMIHESVAPHGGAFHAKLWLLRFSANEGKDSPLLRLVVPSRNLTSDRSWDLCLQMEGKPERRILAANKPLSGLIATLPKFTSKPLTEERTAELSALSREVSRCRWNLPKDFNEVRFHVLGTGRQPTRWLPERSEEMGVISPFLGELALKALQKSTDKPVFLLSRGEEMDRMPSVLSSFERCITLNPQAEVSDEEDVGLVQLRGLHAKAYVLKKGWNTHLVIGSANATDAALIRGSNVEILVELIGRYSKIGRPESWISGEKGLQEILIDYTPPKSPLEVGPTPDAKRLEKMAGDLTKMELELHCAYETDGWNLTLHSTSLFKLDDIIMDVRPLSVAPERAITVPDLNPAQPVDLGILMAAEITSLTAFRLRLGDEEVCFALDLPLHGGPEDREQAILRSILRNREAFVRYLLLLLADWDQVPTIPASRIGNANGLGSWGSESLSDAPLFEMLAQAWARDPERLDEVAAMVERLHDTNGEHGEPILPEDFLEVWKVFKTAMANEASS